MEKKLALEYSFRTVIFTWESGEMIKEMAKEYAFIKMVMCMMANGEIIEKMEKGFLFFQMAGSTKDNGKMI